MPSKNFKDVLKITEDIASGITSIESQQVDKEGKWPSESIKALLNAGLGGLVVNEKFDGLGYGYNGLIQVCEILGRQCGSTALCFGMHNVASAMISAKANQFQIDNYLEPIVRGKHLTTLALSEPGTGAHFYLPQTKMTRNGSGLLLNGKKTFVTNGGKADSYVASVVGDEWNTPVGEFSCVIVDKNTKGIEWGHPWNGMGMRGNSSIGMELKNVRITEEHLLGNEGDQIWYIFNIVAPYFITAMSGTYLGIAGAAFEEARNHLSKRIYGKNVTTLKSITHLQHRLGAMYGKYESTRRLLYYAASRLDSGSPDAVPMIFSSKAEIADTAVHLVNEALTITGGIGYRENGILERLLRDARAAHVMAPTTDLLRLWTGRYLLDEPILSDFE